MTTRCYRRFWASLAISLAIATASVAQVVDVAKDPRLQKPISVRLKIASLPAALKELSKLDGVQLGNVATINDLKVTVLVQDVPAGVVLEKIANVLGCQWKSDGDALRIGMDPEARTRRDRYIDAEEAAARKDAETELNMLASLASIDPAEATKELNNIHAPGLSGLGPGTDSVDPSRITLLKRASNAQDVILGRFLANLDPAKVNSLWRGDVVVGTASAVQGNTAGEASNANGNLDPNQARRVRRPPTGLPMFVQYDPLLYQLQIYTRGALRDLWKDRTHIVTHFAPAGALAKLPFGKEVLAWDQTPPSDGDLTKLALKAGETRSKNSDGLFSISDFLEKAFDETGVPIVADAFRTPSQSKDLNRGVGPVSSWLAVLKKENHLFTRFEDGFILVRHGGFWRLRKFETPEDMLAPLEAKAEKGKLTLDDYAGFVSKLTPEQTRPFRIPDSAIVRFDTHPIEAGLPALLFYASLDSRSIARAQQSGIAFDQLGSAQRQLFVDAALEGLFYGATSTSFSIQLMRLANAGDARGLGFIMRRSSDSGTGENVGGESLLFGANLNESSTYQIPSVQ